MKAAKSTFLLLLLVLLCVFSRSPSNAFLLAPPKRSWAPSVVIEPSAAAAARLPNSLSILQMTMSNEEDSVEEDSATTDIWLPQIRRIMGSIASLGVLETSYLTYNKLLQQGTVAFCGTDSGGGCNDILYGPYSNVPFTDIPLSAMGLLAYLTVLGLSLFPLLSPKENDTLNRILLTTATTIMGTFSIFLMTLLFGVLQTDCPYCEFSAACSITLAMLAWIGGCLPAAESSKQGGQNAAAYGFLASSIFAILLFVAGDASSTIANINSAVVGGSSSSSRLLASAASGGSLLAPPPITTESSARAISLAKDLQSLDAKMFGAYWCSHCYDQKETFGKQAFSKIPYIECSKDGLNSQTKLCKSKDVPGYPTWEINGKLYPGEQELEELEEIVVNLKK